jgi:hypothetical protein
MKEHASLGSCENGSADGVLSPEDAFVMPRQNDEIYEPARDNYSGPDSSSAVLMADS